MCTDIARYAIGLARAHAGRARALVVRERPRLFALEVGASGSYARDVYDFWRPLGRREALVDGHFSVACYLDALAGAYREWLRLAGEGEPLARTCYHVPYGKMAIKAHRRRKQIDGVAEPEADASFAVEVAPSLVLPSQVGNVYTARALLYLAPAASPSCTRRRARSRAGASASSATDRAARQSSSPGASCRARRPGPSASGSPSPSKAAAGSPSPSTKTCGATT